MSSECRNDAEQQSKDYQTAIQNVVNHLKFKRQELLTELNSDEQEKQKVLKEIGHLQDKLSVLDATIRKKSDFTKEYDKAINQSEEHFTQLLKKSEDFLTLTRREALAVSHVMRDCPTGSLSEVPKNSAKISQVSEGPPAVIAFNPPDGGGCMTCANSPPCAAVMVPFRANGL